MSTTNSATYKGYNFPAFITLNNSSPTFWREKAWVILCCIYAMFWTPPRKKPQAGSRLALPAFWQLQLPTVSWKCVLNMLPTLPPAAPSSQASTAAFRYGADQPHCTDLTSAWRGIAAGCYHLPACKVLCVHYISFSSSPKHSTYVFCLLPADSEASRCSASPVVEHSAESWEQE